MRISERGGLWMTIAAGLFGIVLAGGSAWFAVGQEVVTRIEVERMIKEQSPFIREKNAISIMLNANTAAVERLTEAIEQLKVQQAITNARLNALIVQKPTIGN